MILRNIIFNTIRGISWCRVTDQGNINVGTNVTFALSPLERRAHRQQANKISCSEHTWGPKILNVVLGPCIGKSGTVTGYKNIKNFPKLSTL